MRELNQAEVRAVSGGELLCSAGIPSGVSCKGTPEEFKQAGIRIWALAAISPLGMPGIIMRVHSLSR